MTMTDRERSVLRLAFIDSALEPAMARGMTAAQLRDAADRAVKSGKIFLRASGDPAVLDEMAGFTGSQMLDLLADDPANKHLFKSDRTDKGADDSANNPGAQFGMSKEQFEKLPPEKRLALVNAATMKKAK